MEKKTVKRDWGEVPHLWVCLWAVGFMCWLTTASIFSRRRQQPILSANMFAKQSPAMGILCNFFPLVSLCLNKNDKATLYTMPRLLHCCCVLWSEGSYSKDTIPNAGGFFWAKTLFFCSPKSKSALTKNFREGVTNLCSRKREDVNISFKHFHCEF